MEAREKFITACGVRSLVVDSQLNPNAKGANGEALYSDIVQIGSTNAMKVLLLLSGTHGVEGYCGSGAQTALLSHGYFDNLPSDLSVIMIHAMNPFGFSHDRRVTEDNVDLNRNFLDVQRPDLPGNEYARIHEYLLPDDWDGAGREYADKQLSRFIEEHGIAAFQAAVSSGQYQYPGGIFFGGNTPSWSNDMFQSFLDNYLADKTVVGTIDFHTGLGPYGYGELIAIGSAPQKALAAKWYADQVTDPEAGTSTSAPLDGMVAHAMVETLTEAELAFITIEFGTYDINTVLTALRGDNWLYQKGDLDSEIGATIKRDIRTAFYPDTDDWKLSVWSRASAVVQMALNGINQIE